jgi:hypothetical protein
MNPDFFLNLVVVLVIAIVFALHFISNPKSESFARQSLPYDYSAEKRHVASVK